MTTWWVLSGQQVWPDWWLCIPDISLTHWGSRPATGGLWAVHCTRLMPTPDRGCFPKPHLIGQLTLVLESDWMRESDWDLRASHTLRNSRATDSLQPRPDITKHNPPWMVRADLGHSQRLTVSRLNLKSFVDDGTFVGNLNFSVLSTIVFYWISTIFSSIYTWCPEVIHTGHVQVQWLSLKTCPYRLQAWLNFNIMTFANEIMKLDLAFNNVKPKEKSFVFD